MLSICEHLETGGNTVGRHGAAARFSDLDALRLVCYDARSWHVSEEASR